MIKIIIIGLGVMGKNHYRTLKKIDSCEIVGICDTLDNKEYDEPIFLNLDEILEKIQFDSAIIAAPTHLHKEIALKCIKAKKDIFIEKPVSASFEESQIIDKEAKKHKVKVCVGHIERFNPSVLALKKEIQNKEIYNINITRIGPNPERIQDVGILTDLAVHDIDLIPFITNLQIQSTAIYKSQKIHKSHEDNAILSFNLENNVIASISTNWLTPFRKRIISVSTNDGYYEADLLEQKLTKYSNHDNNSYTVKKCFVPRQEPLLNELNAFINFLKTGNIGNLSTVNNSGLTLKIISESKL